MDQEINKFSHLDKAAREVTTSLISSDVRHAFIGGYAASLIGGDRMTRNASANFNLDLDIIVDADPNVARALLLRPNSGFTVTSSNKLIFKVAEGVEIPIELLQGGSNRQLKLPDAKTVDILPLTEKDQPSRILEETPIPVVNPSVLVLTKIKRWASISESTRPLSIRKRTFDVQDITVILRWLARNDMKISFEGYPEKREEDLRPLVRKLYKGHPAIRPLLEVTLIEKELHFIKI